MKTSLVADWMSTKRTHPPAAPPAVTPKLSGCDRLWHRFSGVTSHIDRVLGSAWNLLIGVVGLLTLALAALCGFGFFIFLVALTLCVLLCCSPLLVPFGTAVYWRQRTQPPPPPPLGAGRVSRTPARAVPSRQPQSEGVPRRVVVSPGAQLLVDHPSPPSPLTPRDGEIDEHLNRLQQPQQPLQPQQRTQPQQPPPQLPLGRRLSSGGEPDHDSSGGFIVSSAGGEGDSSIEGSIEGESPAVVVPATDSGEGDGSAEGSVNGEAPSVTPPPVAVAAAAAAAAAAVPIEPSDRPPNADSVNSGSAGGDAARSRRIARKQQQKTKRMSSSVVSPPLNELSPAPTQSVSDQKSPAVESTVGSAVGSFTTPIRINTRASPASASAASPSAPASEWKGSAVSTSASVSASAGSSFSSPQTSISIHSFHSTHSTPIPFLPSPSTVPELGSNSAGTLPAGAGAGAADAANEPDSQPNSIFTSPAHSLAPSTPGTDRSISDVKSSPVLTPRAVTPIGTALAVPNASVDNAKSPAAASTDQPKRKKKNRKRN